MKKKIVLDQALTAVTNSYLKADNVNHPSHYASGKIEVIEAIEDWGLNFHRGNVVKYVARAGKKNPARELEDLEKALWYLQREMARLVASKSGYAVPKPNDMPIERVPEVMR